jgi:ABC-type multidrug transport system ATPase subunit
MSTPLLALEGVHKRYEQGREVLRGVAMELQAGELAVVWGLRRSGRSTLLRIAAGIEPPDAGSVRFEGADMASRGERLLGSEIGYCQKMLPLGDAQTALDHAMVGMLSRWVSPTRARGRALAALERVGAGHCARMRQRELSAGESVRVALARTLTLAPRLLVVDEPVRGVELTERDGILSLLRALADEGVTVLASTGESTGLSQADRAFVLGHGELRSAPARPAAVSPGAQVVSLRSAAARRG